MLAVHLKYGGSAFKIWRKLGKKEVKIPFLAV